MKILLTGATGYIGKRLLPVLLKEGYHVVCCVRDKKRFSPPSSSTGTIEIIEVDFLNHETLDKIPDDIDAAYYLMHSMSGASDYEDLELIAAGNFREVLSARRVKHVIYLGGIVNDQKLSKHLSSRLAVERKLSEGHYPLTTLRAGIIIGSGSASFEIIRDLVEKLPIMVAPRWLNTYCQPIGVRDVIQFLHKALFNEALYDKNFDIGGPDILTYKQMLLGYAQVRDLKRWIYIVPVMTPRLSSYWLYFITATSFKLASALVDSMKVEVICRKSAVNNLLGISPANYNESLKRTLNALSTEDIVSSWKDSLISGPLKQNLSAFTNIPQYGCYKDERVRPLRDRQKTLKRVWSIGGDNGWYYANILWQLRGFIDKIFGGVGLRRGRTNPTKIAVGDVIDFWRVLGADFEEGHLILFAEMKLPGEAWLEFKIMGDKLIQTATFRPKGLWGRIYWYSVLPFHSLIFNGLINYLVKA